MTSNLPRRRAVRRVLRLWPVGPAFALVFATALAVAAMVFFAGCDLLGAQGLHTERFTTAVSQLGEESAAVRLGGVHALANDAPNRDLRQTCIDVLCAYLRLPYTAEADIPPGDTDSHHAYLALREIRHTGIRLIRDHLRLAPEDPHSWQGHDLDFTGVVFDGGNFSSAVFSGGTIRFDSAMFSGSRVSFDSADEVAPSRLVPSGGLPPTRLSLPPGWY
jgi:hypothetical protein